MEVSKILLLLSYIQGVYSNINEHSCTEQLGSVIVEEAGSVVLPCNFSYFTNQLYTEVRVYWRSGSIGRCGNNQYIYNHTEKWVHANYTNRISMVGDPQRERSATIRIQNLSRSDGPMFCCRIHILNDEKITKSWQNINGTYIQFKDRVFVEQPEVVPAIPKEDISIPCVVHNVSSDSIKEVSWSRGESDLCSENRHLRVSSVRGAHVSPGKYILHIKASRNDGNQRYCCEWKTSAGLRTSIRGTRVAIADSNESSSDSFTVTQTGTTLAQAEDFVNMSCSYNVQSDLKPLWIGVFWRVGSEMGHYAYHPSNLMVHSNYTGRTQLILPAHLQIQKVQGTDHNKYFCFVMMKFCTGNNIVNSVVKYGGGTLLIINGSNTKTKEQGLTEMQKRAIIAGVTVLLVFIVLCIILVFLKKKGFICDKKRRKQSASEASNTASRAPITAANENMTHEAKPAAVSEESGGIVYADINMKFLQEGAGKINKGNLSSSDTQVLYAAVRPTTKQDLYSNVKHPENSSTSDDKALYATVKPNVTIYSTVN